MRNADNTKCCRCENKSFSSCKDCDSGNNFKARYSYEEYKRLRKEKSRNEKNQKGRTGKA